MDLSRRIHGLSARPAARVCGLATRRVPTAASRQGLRAQFGCGSNTLRSGGTVIWDIELLPPGLTGGGEETLQCRDSLHVFRSKNAPDSRRRLQQEVFMSVTIIVTDSKGNSTFLTAGHLPQGSGVKPTKAVHLTGWIASA